MSVGCLPLEVFWAHPAVRPCNALYSIWLWNALVSSKRDWDLLGEKIMSGLAKELQLGNSGES